MDVLTAEMERIENEWRKLCNQWGNTRQHWNDRMRHSFDREFWQELDHFVPAYLRKLQDISQLIGKAYRNLK